MKKFQFTLQKLMDFRQQELDRQKNTLSALQADLQRIYAEKEQLIKQVEEFSAELETARERRLLRSPCASATS